MSDAGTVRLDSNVNGGGTWELAPHVLLVGPSAGGKSTITKSIELALAAGVSDLHGRAWVAAPRDLVDALAPKHAPELLTSRIAWPGGQSETAYKLEGDQVKKQKTGSKPDALVLRDLNEAITGSAEKGQRFVLGAVAKKLGDVFSRIPEEHRKFVSSLAQGRADAEGLQVAREQLRSLVKNKAIIEPRSPDRMQPTDQAIADAEELVATCIRLGNIKAMAGVLDQIDSVDAEIAAIGDIPANEPTGGPDYGAILKVARMMQHADTGSCLACGQEIDAGVQALHVAELDALVSGFAAEWSAATERNRQLVRTRDRLLQLQTQRNRLQASVDRLGATEAEIDAAVEYDPEWMRNAQTERDQLVDLRASWTRYNRECISQEAEKAQQTTYKAVLAVLDDVIGELATMQLDVLVSAIQAYMPDGMQFDCTLSPFRIGLVRDGILYTGLSGGERLTVLIAMACGIAELQELKFAVVIPPETDVDDDMLGRVMAATAGSTVTVILQTTSRTPPSVEGWQVIETRAGWILAEGAAQAAVGSAAPTPRAPRATKADGEAKASKAERKKQEEDSVAAAAVQAMVAAGPVPLDALKEKIKEVTTIGRLNNDRLGTILELAGARMRPGQDTGVLVESAQAAAVGEA